MRSYLGAAFAKVEIFGLVELSLGVGRAVTGYRPVSIEILKILVPGAGQKKFFEYRENFHLCRPLIKSSIAFFIKLESFKFAKS